MYSKFRKNNSNFNTLYFLIGSCHTPEGAYFLIKENIDVRKTTLDQYKANLLRNEARLIELNSKLAEAKTEAKKLKIEADLLDLKNSTESNSLFYESALDEYNFLLDCLEKLDGIRENRDLSDIQAHEASQRVEWRLEMIFRAENFLLTQGRIPADEFATFRMHPDFQSHIFPAINELSNLLELSKLDINKIIPEQQVEALKDKEEAIKKLENKLMPTDIIGKLKLLGE